MTFPCQLQVIRTLAPQCDASGRAFVAVEDPDQHVIWVWEQATDAQARHAICRLCPHHCQYPACPIPEQSRVGV